MPDIMVGTVGKSSHVDDESKNKRGVSKLKYPVEHGTATDWDDARKRSRLPGCPHQRYGKSGVDSLTTAIVNQSGLRLTPWKPGQLPE